ncbi:MAG: ABC transporter ATP-binding protein [Thermoanaerobaculia bacterium]
MSIRGLIKRFGANAALAGVDLEVGEGEVLGLLGPNGAGKSTLVRALIGRVRPDEGEIRIFDRPADSPGARALVGYVPQEIALYALLSARENLAVFGRYLGLDGAALAKGVERGLEFANLADRASEPTRDFSGGMKRRLNFAVGILNSPRLVLLDEPTVGVDPQSRERLYAMVEELRASGATVLYATHYMEEAERLCDRVAVIDHGRVIALGTQAELVRRTIGEGRELTVETQGELPPALRAELAVAGARIDGARIARVSVDPTADVPRLLAMLESAGVTARDLRLAVPSLEQVFLHLTGRELRE